MIGAFFLFALLIFLVIFFYRYFTRDEGIYIPRIYYNVDADQVFVMESWEQERVFLFCEDMNNDESPRWICLGFL